MNQEAVINAIAGGIASCASLSITYPLMTISTRLQCEDEKMHLGRLINRSEGIFQKIAKILDNEGFGKLYAGLVPALGGTILSAAFYYYFYVLFRNFAEGRQANGLPKRQLGATANLIIGFLAAAVNVSITQPVWTLSARMQTNTSKSGSVESGLVSNFSKIINELGIIGLWSGLAPALVLCVNPAIQYMVYEKIKQVVYPTQKRFTAMQVFVLAVIGKLAATLVTYPWIVVKTRLQAEKAAKDASMVSTTIELVEREGVLSLYKGLGMKIYQSLLNAAIMFVLHDKILHFLLKRNIQK